MTGNELTDLVTDLLPKMIERVRVAAAGLTPDQLNQPTASGDWSIAQILDHMMLAHGSYLEILPPAIAAVGPGGEAPVRLTGIGKFLVKASGPGGNAPAPKPFVPKRAPYDPAVLEEWVAQTNQLRDLFLSARGKDVNRKSLRNPIFKIFGMNIADVMSIAEAHFERHVGQIEERAATVRAMG